MVMCVTIVFVTLVMCHNGYACHNVVYIEFILYPLYGVYIEFTLCSLYGVYIEFTLYPLYEYTQSAL